MRFKRLSCACMERCGIRTSRVQCCGGEMYMADAIVVGLLFVLGCLEVAYFALMQAGSTLTLDGRLEEAKKTTEGGNIAQDVLHNAFTMQARIFYPSFMALTAVPATIMLTLLYFFYQRTPLVPSGSMASARNVSTLVSNPGAVTDAMLLNLAEGHTDTVRGSLFFCFIISLLCSLVFLAAAPAPAVQPVSEINAPPGWVVWTSLIALVALWGMAYYLTLDRVAATNHIHRQLRFFYGFTGGNEVPATRSQIVELPPQSTALSVPGASGIPTYRVEGVGEAVAVESDGARTIGRVFLNERS